MNKLQIKSKIPSYFVIANTWGRQCDKYQYIPDLHRPVNYCSECSHCKQINTCNKCGEPFDVPAKFIKNGSYKGTGIEWFCSKDSVFVKCARQNGTRMPHCLDKDGNQVTSTDGIDGESWNIDFIKKHVIDKEPMPVGDYGLIL
jgi:hypothetical protein